MFIRTRSRLLVCVSVALSVSVTGCFRGPELGAVTGTVTLDGEPLANAEVVFQPPGGSPSVATTDSAGRYELEYTKDKPGAVLGTHTVRITAQTTKVDESGNEVQIPQRVPERYNYRSQLLREVKPGENKFDFDLKTEPEIEQPGTEQPEADQPGLREPGAEKPADKALQAEQAGKEAPEAAEPGAKAP